jgi:hypothetical protein
MPGLWAISMANDALFDTCRSRSSSCAAPAPCSGPLHPDLEGVPERGEDGRQCLAGPERRGAQHHRRPDVRGGQVGGQDFGSPALQHQWPVGIGQAELVPAGLGMAEQPEALHSGASGRGVPESLGIRKAANP